MEWILAKNRMPDIGENVIVRTEYYDRGKVCNQIFIGYWNESGELYQLPDDDSYGWEFNDCVTHWIPVSALPSPPKPQEP